MPDQLPVRRGPRTEKANYGPHKLDPVKALVAQTVQHHLVSYGDGREQIPLPPKPDNVESSEGQAVSPTETLVRIVTSNQGVRYFRVKVSEML
jgi:hypothetical protein